MIRSVMTSLFVSVAVSAVAFAIGVWTVRNQLATRPPIAIVDYQPIVNALALGVSADQISPFLQATKTRAKAYRTAGYVVINAASIDAAPSDVYVPPLDDLPEAWIQPPNEARPNDDLSGVLGGSQ